MAENDPDAFAAHEALKTALRMKDSSLAAIARQVGVSRTTVTLVGLRRLRVPRVEEALADAIDRPVDEVFGPIIQEEKNK